MAQKTRTYLESVVKITPYKFNGDKEHDEFNHLKVITGYQRGHGYYYAYQPCWVDGGRWGCILGFGSKDPLTSCTTIYVQDAAKFNNGTLQTMQKNVTADAAKKIIAYLFDKRAFDILNLSLKHIAANGEWATEGLLATLQKQMGDTTTDETNNSTNNNSNSKTSTTMANNVKGADLIGKSIIGGNNVFKYTITDVQADGKVLCTFERQGMTMPNVPFALDFLLNLITTKKAHWEGDETAEQTTETATTDNATAEQPTAENENDENDVEEVDAEEAIAQPTAKVVRIKPESVGATATEPKTEPKTVKATKTKTTEPKSEGAKVTYKEYTTKKGKTGGKIVGFAENDPILNGGLTHASKTWEKDKKGNRIYCLLFGPKYTDAAKAICEAINNGTTDIAELQAIVDGNTEALAQKRAEWKQKAAERKAEREAAKEAKANEPKTETKATKSAKTTGKTYSKADVDKAVDKALAEKLALIAKGAGLSVEDLKNIMATAA